MIAGKIWGTTESIFNQNNVSIHRISVKKGGVCSKHCHLYKHNVFFIESGKLKVLIWQKDYNLLDETILENGESINIKPGLFHQFIALENTVAYEIYYTSIDDDDIIRESCGYLNLNE